jgi:hypothetical protein
MSRLVFFFLYLSSHRHLRIGDNCGPKPFYYQSSRLIYSMYMPSRKMAITSRTTEAQQGLVEITNEWLYFKEPEWIQKRLQYEATKTDNSTMSSDNLQGKKKAK